MRGDNNNISMYVNVCKLCVRETERERESMCFPYIIKRNFVAKNMDMICRFILLFTIFICLASVVVCFGSFAVFRL